MGSSEAEHSDFGARDESSPRAVLGFILGALCADDGDLNTRIALIAVRDGAIPIWAYLQAATSHLRSELGDGAPLRVARSLGLCSLVES